LVTAAICERAVIEERGVIEERCETYRGYRSR
jgi:hypothetical protein